MDIYAAQIMREMLISVCLSDNNERFRSTFAAECENFLKLTELRTAHREHY